MTAGETIAHLLHLYAQPATETPARANALTPVYTIYQRKRVEGHFDRSTGALSIPLAVLRGSTAPTRTPKSPPAPPPASTTATTPRAR